MNESELSIEAQITALRHEMRSGFRDLRGLISADQATRMAPSDRKRLAFVVQHVLGTKRSVTFQVSDLIDQIDLAQGGLRSELDGLFPGPSEPDSLAKRIGNFFRRMSKAVLAEVQVSNEGEICGAAVWRMERLSMV